MNRRVLRTMTSAPLKGIAFPELSVRLLFINKRHHNSLLFRRLDNGKLLLVLQIILQCESAIVHREGRRENQRCVLLANSKQS